MAELLPHPDGDAYVDESLPSGARDGLLRDLLKELRVGSLEDPDVRTRALALLNQQMRASVLKAGELPKVRGRLGNKGILVPSQYQLVFQQNFVDLNETLGVTRDEVRSAVAEPSFVDHLSSGDWQIDDAKRTSVFVKHVAAQDPYTLIVIALRDNAVLKIDGAWRCFHSDVDFSEHVDAVGYLRAFVEKFGYEVKVGPKVGRFILYETIVVSPYDRAGTDVLTVLGPSPFDFRFSFRGTPFAVNVAFAFAIDLTLYVQSLRDHGVSIKRKIEPKDPNAAVTHLQLKIERK